MAFTQPMSFSLIRVCVWTPQSAISHFASSLCCAGSAGRCTTHHLGIQPHAARVGGPSLPCFPAIYLGFRALPGTSVAPSARPQPCRRHTLCLAHPMARLKPRLMPRPEAGRMGDNTPPRLTLAVAIDGSQADSQPRRWFLAARVKVALHFPL
jgi:hypothetical protein